MMIRDPVLLFEQTNNCRPSIRHRGKGPHAHQRHLLHECNGRMQLHSNRLLLISEQADHLVQLPSFHVLHPRGEGGHSLRCGSFGLYTACRCQNQAPLSFDFPRWLDLCKIQSGLLKQLAPSLPAKIQAYNH